MLRNNQGIIRFIAAFIIVFCHLPWVVPNTDSIFLYLCLCGYLAVGVFFFFSGYNLVYGYMEKEDYLKGFIYKKTVKVLLPYIVACSITYAWLLLTHVVLPNEISFMSFVGNNGFLWYMPAVFLLYIVFWVIFGLFGMAVKNRKYALIIPVILTFFAYGFGWKVIGGRMDLPITANDCFPLCLMAGMLFPIFEDKLKTFFVKFRWPVVFVSFLGFFVIHTRYTKVSVGPFNYLEYTSPLFFTVMLVFLFCFENRIENKSLIWLSGLTTEVYLYHYFAMRVFRNHRFWMEKEGLFVLLYVVLLVIVSFCANRLFGVIKRKILK